MNDPLDFSGLKAMAVNLRRLADTLEDETSTIEELSRAFYDCKMEMFIAFGTLPDRKEKDAR